MLFSIDEATTIVHGSWNRRKQYLVEQACSLLLPLLLNLVNKFYTITWLLCAFSLVVDRYLLNDTHKWPLIHVRSRQQTYFAFFMPQKSFNETISIFSPKYREVLASRSVLDMEDRTDWKACKLSKEKEKQLTAEFRKKYQPFDISL